VSRPRLTTGNAKRISSSEKLQPIQVKFEPEVNSLTRQLKEDEKTLSKAEPKSQTRASSLRVLGEELRSVPERFAQIEKGIEQICRINSRRWVWKFDGYSRFASHRGLFKSD
jgi:hypothetical protein